MEIEVKAKIEKLLPLQKLLEKQGLRFGKAQKQVDHYFKMRGHEEEPQGPGSVLLRIRECDNKLIVTLKGLTARKGVWEETEVEASDKNIFAIFKALGYCEILKLQKIRRTAHYKKYTVALDKIQGLGDYIEVERIGRNGEKIQAEIIDWLKSLGIQQRQIERRGYVQILLMRQGVRYAPEK